MIDWLTMPPISALRAFSVYAQTENMARAGHALNVTHAAISQQIRNLETFLGVALLDRSGRAATLTPEGQALAQALTLGFGAISQAVDSLSQHARDQPVQISLTPTFAANWLMPRLAQFSAAHPEINLRLDPSPLVVDFATGGPDLAIRFGDGQWPGLETSPLVATNIVVVGAPSLVGDQVFDTPEQLQVFPWVQELGLNEASDWLRRHGVNKKPGLSEMPGNLMLDAARNGQGIAVTARVFVEPDLAAGRLRLLFEDEGAKSYHIVRRPGAMRPPVKTFVQWLRRQSQNA